MNKRWKWKQKSLYTKKIITMQNMENEGFFPLFIRTTVKPRNFYLKHTKKVTINAKISIYQSKTIYVERSKHCSSSVNGVRISSLQQIIWSQSHDWLTSQKLIIFSQGSFSHGGHIEPRTGNVVSYVHYGQ